MPIHEDVVIAIFSRALRATGSTVLAEGGNQMRAFRFVTSSGRRKAPDLVVYKDGVLDVYEAKVSARALFRPALDGMSDYQVMVEILEREDVQVRFLEEAVRRLTACGYRGSVPRLVRAGLIASESISQFVPQVAPSRLRMVHVDVPGRQWTLESV